MEERRSYVHIWQTLAAEKHMVFLSGPRQAGKTTLARLIARDYPNHVLCNWDIPDDRARVLETPTFFTAMSRRDGSTPLVVFDEVHKYRRWKNYLKGTYDRFAGEYQFLVTGSGRLDLYQKGGDSLAGRYLAFQLWPFTLGELGGLNDELQDFLRDPLRISLEHQEELAAIWARLEALSGFPEPYLSDRVSSYRRWTSAYSQRLVREDIRDLTGLQSVTEVETLYHLLPSRVGSPLSVPSLAKDLRVAYNSVRSWLSIFERFYLTFSLPTWTTRVARAIHKERKVYLLDVPRVKGPAARFENQVALELWRAVSCWNALGGGEFSLHFIRNKDGQEVDFLIANEREPFLLIEAALTDEQPDKPLRAIQRAIGVPAVQLVREATTFRRFDNGTFPILVAPASPWLARLPF